MTLEAGREVGLPDDEERVAAVREAVGRGLEVRPVRREELVYVSADPERSLIGAWCFLDHYGPDDIKATTRGNLVYYVRELAIAYRAKGHDPIIITNRWPRDLPDHDVERFTYVSSSMVFERATEFPTTEAHIRVGLRAATRDRTIIGRD